MSREYNALREAILARQQVACTYHGYNREICPHVLGLKNGREKVLTYQFGGGSSSHLPPDGEWRCMFVDEISDVSTQKGPWHTGTGHSRPQTCVDDIDVEIDY